MGFRYFILIVFSLVGVGCGQHQVESRVLRMDSDVRPGEKVLSSADELFVLVQNGQVEELKQRIESGADVNEADQDGKVLLMEALAWNQYEVFRLLLEMGADFQVVDNAGNDVLSYAGEDGGPQSLRGRAERLIAFFEGADTERSELQGELVLAIVNGDPQALNRALSEMASLGVDPTFLTEDGHTPLIKALLLFQQSSGDADQRRFNGVIQVLLRNPAIDVTVQDDHGNTAVSVIKELPPSRYKSGMEQVLQHRLRG